MGFFVSLTEAIAENQSLLVTGLDPNPEMLQNWVQRRGMAGRSFLSQARYWIKEVVEATSTHVCAYKPSLGFYQALGPIGLELLREVRELVPLSIPLIIDAKHGDLNTSSALAHYLFRDLGADAVTLSPLAGQDIAAPFLLHPSRAVVVTCHSSNAAARVLQHYPDETNPLYLRIVRECQLWATPEQLLLEVGTSDPEILARVRQEAPERFLILRSLWGEEERLEALLQAGLTAAADGLLLPLPQNLLVEDDIGPRAEQLKLRIEEQRLRCLEARPIGGDGSCQLWLPQPEAAVDPMEELIVDLFDIGCLLFGEYVQASGAVFNYYIDLRQIISDPNLFHRVLHAYAEVIEGLPFDRIAGIPYGSLPTATGLSLQLHKPLIYPRKEVKAHGARRLIEGDFDPGDRVLVVDDILITGRSVLEGIGKLESSGLIVDDVVVFIDHGGVADSSARERLDAAGVRCHAVLDIDRITAALRAVGRIGETELAVLEHRTPVTASVP
ncbi:bifunctional orotidine-5'-phosphate decarboxylase/orotate phosphoribosyltransferase [Synechococcus sp. CBW1002]|uniref:bifunctional orotidine-5'-phosphate decarboxylase/orotate phosphoribosyltransferase n=1 Tax=Synechococcus sp. CBW1002 TaxID=1353134 RepID=UPI0018CE5125|nr:bifunctional orotidine-5'-phosphate decarboxylase/orotate phosphoribosyltransferase [Synechococcus sp. CBW1002]QPN59944.1 bifunctional orotidine-5'-phosphate decarboxylase/orotate phosphoribosyltransferase [Synechococcus sp. CBW1002]